MSRIDVQTSRPNNRGQLEQSKARRLEAAVEDEGGLAGSLLPAADRRGARSGAV